MPLAVGNPPLGGFGLASVTVPLIIFERLCNQFFGVILFLSERRVFVCGKRTCGDDGRLT